MGEEDISIPSQTYANCGILLLQSKGSCLPITWDSINSCVWRSHCFSLSLGSLAEEQVIVSKLVLPDLNGWSLGHRDAKKEPTIDLIAAKHRWIKTRSIPFLLGSAHPIQRMHAKPPQLHVAQQETMWEWAHPVAFLRDNVFPFPPWGWDQLLPLKFSGKT